MRPGPLSAWLGVVALGVAAWLVLREPAPEAPAMAAASERSASSAQPAPTRFEAPASAGAAPEVRAGPRRIAAELALDAPSQSVMGEPVEVAIRLQTTELPRRITFDLAYDAAAFHLSGAEKGDFVARSAGPMQFEVDDSAEGRIRVTAVVAPDASLRDGGSVAIVRLEPILPAASTIKLDGGFVVPRSAGSAAIATPHLERSVVVF